MSSLPPQFQNLNDDAQAMTHYDLITALIDVHNAVQGSTGACIKEVPIVAALEEIDLEVSSLLYEKGRVILILRRMNPPV